MPEMRTGHLLARVVFGRWSCFLVCSTCCLRIQSGLFAAQTAQRGSTRTATAPLPASLLQLATLWADTEQLRQPSACQALRKAVPAKRAVPLAWPDPTRKAVAPRPALLRKRRRMRSTPPLNSTARPEHRIRRAAKRSVRHAPRARLRKTAARRRACSQTLAVLSIPPARKRSSVAPPVAFPLNRALRIARRARQASTARRGRRSARKRQRATSHLREQAVNCSVRLERQRPARALASAILARLVRPVVFLLSLTCASGSFASGRGNIACTAASAGSFANKTASTQFKCPAGRYSALTVSPSFAQRVRPSLVVSVRDV